MFPYKLVLPDNMRMNKGLFYRIDRLLPRWVAIIPYSIALIFIRVLLKLCFGFRTKVWGRNSTKSKTFVFGISDLDLTVLSHNSLSRPLLSDALAISKRIFPFLGETHFYSPEHLTWVLPFINIYELRRDPELMRLMGLEEQNDNIEKFVFLQRMFFSDAHTLKSKAEYRKQKWRHHFKLTEINFPYEIPTVDSVKSTIVKLVPQYQGIESALENWLQVFEQPNLDIYRADLGSDFKLLAPHKYFWFSRHAETDREYLLNLLSDHKMIVSRQVDWEIWGLYCQRYWMNEDQVVTHLSRLIKVKAILEPSLNERILLEEVETAFRSYFKLSRQSS